MTDFDDKVRSALQSDRDPGEAEIATVRGLVAETFRMKGRMLLIVGLSKIAGSALLGIVAGWFLFTTDDDRARLLWGIVFLTAYTTLAWVSTFHWMMLNRNAVLREVKRLEVQVAGLQRSR